MSGMLDDRDIEPKGNHLLGKTIDLVVSGGIACIETPKLIRELRRYGAEIRVFMTPAAIQFVSPLVNEWASKNKVVTIFLELRNISHFQMLSLLLLRLWTSFLRLLWAWRLRRSHSCSECTHTNAGDFCSFNASFVARKSSL